MRTMRTVFSLILGSLIIHSEASSIFRRLDDASAQQQGDDAYFQYDLANFSVRFDKCQYVKMYDDELAEDEEEDSPLALKHFVIFRLCPSAACGACEDTVHGTYTVDVSTYLESTIDYQKKAFENMCQSCGNGCSDDDLNCLGCVQNCTIYNNLADYGYIDASQFTECQKLDYGGGNQNEQEQQNQDANDENQEDADRQQEDAGDRKLDENNGDGSYYIGPRCNSHGKIVIGVFSDDRCWDPVDDVDVETLLGGNLSYLLLQNSYSDDSSCISCMESGDDDNSNDKNDGDNVIEMCEDLYDASAKCESEGGLTSGFIQSNRQEENYENQVENEMYACTFIDSLIWNSYTETGEIDVDSPQDVILRKITDKQAEALSILCVVTVSLVGMVWYFDRELRKISPRPKLFLSCGDGALA